MSGPLDRYQKLKLRDSLSLSFRYQTVCRELGLILRLAYSKVPKTLQALILEDTVAAFRLLPQMQTQTAVSAAYALIQSAEAALPKQKRVLALTEFKQAKVAHKRLSRACKEDEGSLQLPQDVLVHVFSFLDLQSLVSAGSVCKLWNATVSDDYLWESQYATYFCHSNTKFVVHMGGRPVRDNKHSDNAAAGDNDLNWKNAFRRAYKSSPLRRFKYGRGYCGYCKTIVWLDNLKCPNRHFGQRADRRMIEPILSDCQVVTYILRDSVQVKHSSGSESDSDSDGESVYKLWRLCKALTDEADQGGTARFENQC